MSSPFEADHPTDNETRCLTPGCEGPLESWGDKHYRCARCGSVYNLSGIQNARYPESTHCQECGKPFTEHDRLTDIEIKINEIHAAFMALTTGLAELQANPPPGPMGMLMKMFVGNMKLPEGKNEAT